MRVHVLDGAKEIEGTEVGEIFDDVFITNYKMCVMHLAQKTCKLWCKVQQKKIKYLYQVVHTR